MVKLEHFAHKQYLNLETFRKSRFGVRTPVWFAQDGETIFVHTLTNTGKAKRIRNHGQVNIAPCKISREAQSWLEQKTDKTEV
jgi:PPOX class probable F420-dependent enzyme